MSPSTQRPARTAQRRSTTTTPASEAHHRSQHLAPRTGRRVLVTGLGTFWGGRMAQALEADPSVDVILGLDTVEPMVELERTEYVRVDANYSILQKIVRAAQIDTIIHTFLVVDPTIMSPRSMHEINVIGTMNLFAAASAPGSTVRTVIVKSATAVYGCTPEDPTWFTEDTPPSWALRRPVERSLDQVEGYVRDFAEDNPHVSVSVLRFSNVIGTEISTPLTRALEAPMVPSVLGFDAKFQFVHERDVVRSMLFVLKRDLDGVFNVAGDGLIPWSEVASICGKRRFPLIPNVTEAAMWPLRQAGVRFLPGEYLNLLRYGRGVDNSKLKNAGFEYDFTSAQAVQAFIESHRLHRTVGKHAEEYRYERDIEQFFRHSPAVVREAPPYDRRRRRDNPANSDPAVS